MHDLDRLLGDLVEETRSLRERVAYLERQEKAKNITESVLDDLADVTAPAPGSYDLLHHTGVDWIPSPRQALRFNRNGSQTIPNNVFTRVDFNNPYYNYGGGTVTTGTAWRYAVPDTGLYRVDAQVTFDAGSAWTLGNLIWLKLMYGSSGGADPVATWSYLDLKHVPYTSSNMYMTVKGSDIIERVATSTIGIEVQQNSPGWQYIYSSTQYTRIVITRVR